MPPRAQPSSEYCHLSPTPARHATLDDPRVRDRNNTKCRAHDNERQHSESRYTDSRWLTELQMKQGMLIGAGLLAIAGAAFAATGYCPLCLLIW